MNDYGDYDFFDFGCSDGRSLKYGVKRLGASRGLGLDIDPRKVAAARAAGYEAEVLDVTTLASSPSVVRFVIMSHFLEHLSGFGPAKKCIESACIAAREFVLIKQPWFSSDDYLLSFGLKLFWSDWVGHTCKIGALDFQRIISRTPRAARYRIYGKRRIIDSRDPAVIPLASPIDQHQWDERRHGAKEEVVFKQNVFREIVCLIAIDPAAIEAIEPLIDTTALLYDGTRPAKG